MHNQDGAPHEHHYSPNPAAPPPEPQQYAATYQSQQPVPQQTPMAEHAHSDYESDPVKTFTTSFKAFWSNSKRVLAGLLVVQALIFIVGAIFLVVALLALIVVIFSGLLAAGNVYAQYIYEALITQLPSETINAIDTLRANTSIATVVGLVAGFLGTMLILFAQTTSIVAASTAVIHRQMVNFGHTFSLGFKKMWPILVQSLLMVLVGLVIGLVVALLAVVPGAEVILIILGIPFAIGAIYLAARLILAPIAIVADGLGPISSLKYAWHISGKNRTLEILGAAAVVGIISTLCELLFSFIHYGTRNATGADLVVSLVESVVVLFVSMISFAVLAERYRQLKEAGTNHAAHHTKQMPNIVAIVGVIALSLVASSIANALTPTPANLNTDDYYQGLFDNSDNTLPSQQDLQDELEKLYQQNPSTDYNFDDDSSSLRVN